MVPLSKDEAWVVVDDPVELELEDEVELVELLVDELSVVLGVAEVVWLFWTWEIILSSLESLLQEKIYKPQNRIRVK